MITSSQPAAAPFKVFDKTPRVVIVGAGFGGLAAARELRKACAHVIVIDRTNHHVFQPLLYQGAPAGLAPGQIGVPIRSILGRHKNTTVIEGTVTGLDLAAGAGRGHVLCSTAD